MENTHRIIYSSDSFGEYSPYYIIDNDNVKIYFTIRELMENNPQKKYELDIAAVLSLLNFNYILGDRTLIANISKIPWFSKITSEGEVIRKAPFPHNNVQMQDQNVAKKISAYLRRYLYHNGTDNALKSAIEIYRRRQNTETKLYIVNLAGYNNGSIMPQGDGLTHLIAGWSDAIFQYVELVERSHDAMLQSIYEDTDYETYEI